MKIEVREWVSSDIERIVDYFLKADLDFLKRIGADKNKLPDRETWVRNLNKELAKPFIEKSYFYIIWLIDNKPVGHSNVNKIKYGDSATMHLHIWNNKLRKNGLGYKFLKMTVPFYFEKLALEKLICEPKAENVAPNKALIKVGFDFIKTYETTPGLINFRQIVNRYELRNVAL